MDSSKKLLSKKFILLCISSFFFFLSLNTILPELFEFIETIGGESYKGWILFVFTLVAGISRPLSGFLVDSWGRKPVMAIGLIAALIATLLYPFVSVVLWFLILRAFHGISTGFAPTASVAYLSDIIPAHRRGEAMGWMGMSGTLGMAIGPLIGDFLTESYGFTLLFRVASIFAFLSLILVLFLKESRQRRISKYSQSIFMPRAWVFGGINTQILIFFVYYLAFGAVYTLAPDISRAVGLNNKGWFFAVLTFCSIISRSFFGRYSDKKGRRATAIYGVIILFFSLVLFQFSFYPIVLLISGALFGTASGIISPVLFAWVGDKSPPNSRGRAYSTLFISMEAGIGIGSLIAAFLFNSLKWQWYCFSIFAFTTLLLICYLRNEKAPMRGFF